MSTPSTNVTTSAPRLRRTLTLSDLILYGIIVIQPVAPMSVFGVLSDRGRGHVVTTLLIAMVAMLFTAFSYGRMARAYPSAGSAFAYVGQETLTRDIVAEVLGVADRRVLRGGVARERAAQRVLLPLRREHGRARDAGEGRGADEARRARRLDDADRVAGLDRQPGQLERLVGGDPAGDTEQDSGQCRPSGSGT